MKRNWLSSIHCSRGAQNRMNVCYRLPGKKVESSYGNIDFSLTIVLKFSVISSGQGVIQIEPKFIWIIPVYFFSSLNAANKKCDRRNWQSDMSEASFER